MKHASVAHAAVLPDVPEQRLTVVLALATLVSAFGSSFQYGYNVAVINPPEKVTVATNGGSGRFSRLSSADCVCPQFMQQFYAATYLQRYGRPMEDTLLTLLWSLSVSMFPLGGFFGSLMVAPLVNKLGR